MREVGSLCGTCSNGILLVWMNVFFLGRPTLGATRALALARQNGGASFGLPRLVFVVSLAVSYTDIPLYQC
jgi:hypothetical protein